MNWRGLQKLAAEFFASLGCQADIEAAVEGARGRHKVDVLVRFKKFGLEAVWIVECKSWEVAVTKEKVMALKAIVEDVGADRGVLISTAGFQSGAIRASRQTNITLTDLDELRETAQEELLSSALHGLEIRAVHAKHALHDLFTSEHTGQHSWILKPKPGVNGEAVHRAIGALGVLEYGFDRVRLKRPPFPIKFDESGKRGVVAKTIEGFVAQANETIAEAEATVESQRRALK